MLDESPRFPSRASSINSIYRIYRIARNGSRELVFQYIQYSTGDWKTMALKAEVWVEAVTEGGRRFMAAWREEEGNTARHRQEKREATRLGKLQAHTEAA